MMLQRGRDVRQQHKRRRLITLRQIRRERLEHAQLRRERAALVHVHLVFARPVERLARLHLQAREVEPMALVERGVFLREILANDADEIHVAEKAGRDRRVAGGTAEQPRVGSLRGFDGIQRRRTDNQYAHDEINLKIVSREARRTRGGWKAKGESSSALILCGSPDKDDCQITVIQIAKERYKFNSSSRHCCR